MSKKDIVLYNIKNNGGKTMNWGDLPTGTKIVSSYDGGTFSGPVKVGTPTPKGIDIPYYHVGEYVASEHVVYTHCHKHKNSVTLKYYGSPSSYSYSGSRERLGGYKYRGNYSSNQKQQSNQAGFL